MSLQTFFVTWILKFLICVQAKSCAEFILMNLRKKRKIKAKKMGRSELRFLKKFRAVGQFVHYDYFFLKNKI